MRKQLWWGTLVLTVAVMTTQAATNDLTTALQRGLFEEEANRNLEAAIQAYQSVANQFDKDRKLAATAVFRLGECYRKQGNTNGAVAQFERVLRDFSDQSALVTLSRQNLVGLGAEPSGSPATASAAAKDKDAELTNTEAEEVKRIQALIKDSPDLINAAAPATGTTPLHRAAQAGQLVVAQFLLANGADTEARDIQFNGRTPLHYAAAAGHKAMVELLVNKKANVRATDQNGYTPLHVAAENGYRSVVETLLQHGAPVDATDRFGGTPFLLAAGNGFKSVMELLLARGANINASASFVRAALKGTALTIAVLRADHAMAEFLISKNIAVDSVDSDGRTALSYAAEEKDEPMVKLLLAAHANPDAGTVDLPLARAAFTGDVNLLKQLLAAGADPNAVKKVKWRVDTRGFRYEQGGTFSPLFLAVSQHHPEAVTALLHAKADPNAKVPKGSPLVFEAVGDIPTLKALLDGGANPNQPDDQSYTLLSRVMGWRDESGGLVQIANLGSEANRASLTELLLAHGANPNAATPGGWTPLHSAAMKDDTNTMTLLLQKGADVNARTTTGYTPLWLAVEHDHPAAVQWLLEYKADPNYRFANTTVLKFAKNLSSEAQNRRVGHGLGLPPTLPADAAPRAKIVLLLRQYGALDDLPPEDAIELRRPSASFAKTVFTQDTEGRNRFTLAELIGMEYGLLNQPSPPANAPPIPAMRMPGIPFQEALPYPDLAHLRVRKFVPGSKTWQERTVDLTPMLELGVCTNDVPLNWGEVVEIPERDHPIDQNWPGFTLAERVHLGKCLQRHVEIIIKGQRTKVTVGPEFANMPGTGFEPAGTPVTVLEVKPGTLWLRPALLESRLILASSDLSRVKLTRHDPFTGQRHDSVVDCSGATPDSDVWLQNGDVIDVPEKGQSYGAADPTKDR